MHLEILSEDRSGCTVLASVLRALREKRGYDYTFDIRPHRGKGYVPADPMRRPSIETVGLQDLLPAKARAYARVLDPAASILVVVMDADELPPLDVEKAIRTPLRRFAPLLPHVIGICVEEIEAWLLGDREALLAAYPDADLSCLEQYGQDTVCGTWETLARCIQPDMAERIIRIGYPAVGQYKYAWCRDISRYMDPDRNASPSFLRFIEHLENALRFAAGADSVNVRSKEAGHV